MTHPIVVVGGGLGGLAAATVLAERGLDVTLVERESYLGGRAGAWTDTLSSGESFEMERGFHAFFRQYYNVRALLRRVDPRLRMLTPLSDYPILAPGGASQSFRGLPRRAPFNLLALVARTPTIRLRDLPRIRPGAAFDLLAYDAERTYDRLDDMDAKTYLDSLNFPSEARRLLFDVFAHSFFNPEERMSAAELQCMFHFYFTGNPEGLLFDVAREPLSTAIFTPLGRYLEERGVRVLTSTSVHQIDGADVETRPQGDVVASTTDTVPGARARVRLDSGEVISASSVVLALDVRGLKAIAHRSPLLQSHRELATSIASLDVTAPFYVWRGYMDRPSAARRHPFVGTTGFGAVDNISLYHLFEGESARWARRTGGSVVEVHAYGVSESRTKEDLRAECIHAVRTLYPELASARLLDERERLDQDCPSFAPGSHRRRPTVDTPVPGIVLAGDFVRLPFPSALMERAVASGFSAANVLLRERGRREEPVDSISSQGLLPRRAVDWLRLAS
jgi:isorenieratene synthase